MLVTQPHQSKCKCTLESFMKAMKVCKTLQLHKNYAHVDSRSPFHLFTKKIVKSTTSSSIFELYIYMNINKKCRKYSPFQTRSYHMQKLEASG